MGWLAGAICPNREKMLIAWQLSNIVLLRLRMLKVMKELLDKLDDMISEGRGDDEYKQLFTDMYEYSYTI